MGLVNFPVGGFGGHQHDLLVFLQSAADSLGALPGVVGTADALKNRGLGGLGDAFCQKFSGLVGTCFVVDTDEGNGRQACLLHGFGVQTVVNVDNFDARVPGFFQGRHQALRITRGNHDGIHSGGDQVFHQLDLLLDGGFLGGGFDRQVDVEFFFSPPGPFFHFNKERVGQGFHDQSDVFFRHGRGR